MQDPEETLPADRLDAETIVGGRYRIEGAPIGQGGFGVVHRAYDRTLERTVALKLLEPGRGATADDPGFHRFLTEARMVARLDHPHIVPVYDAGVHEGRPWFAMKLVEGESLARLLAREGPLPPARAVKVLAAMARALGHAHRRHVVHRDVKPSNIMIGRSDAGTEHPWLLDFGVARVAAGESTWSERVIAGTPAYMAPEQAVGKGVSGAADQFALACVLVEVLRGKRAFPGGSVSEVVARIVVGEPEGLDDVRDIAGGALAAVVERALAKSSRDRFPDAESLAAALESAIGKRSDTGLLGIVRRLRLKRARAAPWDGKHTLTVSALSKRYVFGRPVLVDLDLDVARGSAYALLGRNGTGKTTLIRTFLGIYRPDRGTVRVFGRDPRREKASVVSRIGHVPPHLTAYERLTVGEFLLFVSRFRESWNESFARHLSARFELPRDMRIGRLSQGMRTKVSLLAALSHRPDFLVLDDPTVGLDAVVLSDFFETLSAISRNEGTTIFIATHNVDEIERIASHVGFLSDGKIVLSSRLKDLLSRSRRVRAAFPDAVPSEAATVGLVAPAVSGRRIAGISAADPEGAATRLRSLGAESIDLEPVGLRELFVAMMR